MFVQPTGHNEMKDTFKMADRGTVKNRPCTSIILVFHACKMTLLCLVFGSMCATAHGQQSALDTLKKRFDRYRTSFPQEKLFLHIDQELYLTGETLWFKAYYVDGSLHHPMDISKVAYVEVLDGDNRPVLQAKIALKDGVGTGALFLPASMNSGNYHLRAYTQWMKNFSPDQFFHKKIAIVNAFKKLEAANARPVNGFTVQFFPEGGHLVNGLKSKVAFQALNNYGRGINFTGFIVNTKNDTIARIRPHKFGIGNFELTPEEGETYSAIITDTLNNLRKFNIPAASSEGYVLQIKDSTSDLLAIRVLVNSAANQLLSPIYYFVHARQIIASAGVRDVVNGKALIVVPKKDLRDGISHITIFDKNLRPQAERLYFKRPEKKIAVTVLASQNEYGVRRKVVLDLAATGNSSDLNLSLAVVRTESLQEEVKGNIYNYIWLTSDLKGTIESPNYYFGASATDVDTALDNLMLTHGWRRFNWTDVLGQEQKKPSFIPEYRGHLVRGLVTDVNGRPSSGIPAYLSSIGKNIQLYTARSNAQGAVQFEMKDFWGRKKIIAQTDTKLDSTLQVKIENPYSDKYATLRLDAFSLPSQVSKSLVNRSVAMQVQDVYYGDSSIKYTLKAIDSTAFYGKPDEIYYLDDYTRFPVMEEVMREYVPGVMVRKRKDGFHFLVLDNVRKTIFQQNPMVMIDGVPVFDIDKIMAFDPLRVKKLEVFTRGYSLGPLVFSGIVSYSTYTGDLNGFQPDPRSVSLDYEGLQRQRIFYAPQYENEKQRESRLPDRRNLLFWDSLVTLKDGEKKQLEFYTSDLTGEYTIVVEGISKDGTCGGTTASFKVKDFNN